MREKLGAVTKYTSINEAEDSASLFRDIKGVAYKYNMQRNPYVALNDAKLKYYAYS